MDEMYGFHSNGDEYVEKGLISAEDHMNMNMMIPEEYRDEYNHHSWMINSIFGCDELGFQLCSTVSQDSDSVNLQINIPREDEEEDSALIKAQIASHPSYSKLLRAYIDCYKIGAPPEIVSVLDEMRRENDLSIQEQPLSTALDPQLDHFMETYCDVLLKFKSDLSRPFDEATSFLAQIQSQLLTLCNDEIGGGVWSEELIEKQDAETKREDRQLKEKLLRMYGSHITSLKLEFSKKKKKGKLPKEGRLTLLSWWNSHSKWPYPTEADKIALGETTGLDQKQINNWFINQRKRHWKSPDNLHFDHINASSNFATDH